VTLKLKKIDEKEEDSTINISKDDVQVLLKGIKKWNLVIKKIASNFSEITLLRKIHYTINFQFHTISVVHAIIR